MTALMIAVYLMLLNVHAAIPHLPFAGSIPVLSYHNIQKNTQTNNHLYIGESQFRKQLKTLHDSGYHTITPARYAAHYQYGSPLPSKPVIITFDDSHGEHYTIARPALDQFGFVGVFFIMTVTIDKKRFLSSEQIKYLAQKGHVIGLHTWDHANLARRGVDWETQITDPVAQLKKISGLQVDCLAYPYGAWNDKTIEELRRRGIRIAFQLAGSVNASAPLLTMRRIMVNGNWSGPVLLKQMQRSFQGK